MRRWMLFAATGAMLTFMLAMAGVALAQEAQYDGADGAEPAAPEVENRNVDSYAAYEAKDPFRQLVEPADADTGSTTGGGTTGGSDGGSGGSDNGIGGGGDSGGSTGDGGRAGGSTSGDGGGQRGQGMDSDDDKVSDNREEQLGLDPANPDTDGDGIRDGADDSNGDGTDDSNPSPQQSIDSTTGEVPQVAAPEQTGDCSDPTFAAINPGICGTTGVNPVLDADDNYSQGVVVGNDTPDCATPEQVLPSGLCAEAPTVTSEQSTPAISVLPDTGGTALHLLPAAGLLLVTGLIGMRLVRRS